MGCNGKVGVTSVLAATARGNAQRHSGLGTETQVETCLASLPARVNVSSRKHIMTSACVCVMLQHVSIGGGVLLLCLLDRQQRNVCDHNQLPRHDSPKQCVSINTRDTNNTAAAFRLQETKIDRGNALEGAGGGGAGGGGGVAWLAG